MTLINTLKQRPLLLLAGAVAAIILLAGGLSQVRLQPAEAFPFALLFGGEATATAPPVSPIVQTPNSLVDFILMFALFLLTLILILWILVFIFKPQARKRMLQRIIMYFIYLLIFASLLNVLDDLKFNEPESVEQDGGALGDQAALLEEAPTPPSFVADPPAWLVTTITIVILALVLTVIWVFLRRQGFFSGRNDQTAIDLIIEEAQQTIEQINQGQDFKNAVIGCYQGMTQVLSEDRGIHRQKSMTPRDFEFHLGQTGLQNEHIQRLTRLFEKVRYGGDRPSQTEEDEAVDCLTAIVQAYGRS